MAVTTRYFTRAATQAGTYPGQIAFHILNVHRRQAHPGCMTSRREPQTNVNAGNHFLGDGFITQTNFPAPEPPLIFIFRRESHSIRGHRQHPCHNGRIGIADLYPQTQ